MDRLIPAIEAIAKLPEVEGKLLSVDTFYSKVASEAVSKGIHLVNDISGGHLDSEMFNVVAHLKVPYIVMHMRGDPSTMQTNENLHYEDVCKQVASELYTRVREAELSGIPSWRMIIDPDIGFSKKNEDNLEILMGLSTIREELSFKSLAASHAPIVIGPSRKKFLVYICSRPNASSGLYAFFLFYMRHRVYTVI
ncbi:hypothetical protein IFM89_019837 [Coptis chinensis]|uniref:Pterin-binding domain-containing protein n=1 Tax=Coptis chinensis TaxID=261450 RepID=A0A835M5L0_9MAGN|nr:hypothetical protein IFM89_019837 [Coptis chinensis]